MSTSIHSLVREGLCAFNVHFLRLLATILKELRCAVITMFKDVEYHTLFQTSLFTLLKAALTPTPTHNLHGKEIMLIVFMFVNQSATLLGCFLTLAARPTVEFSCAVSRTTPWNLRCSFRRRDNRRFPRFAISVLIWVRAAAELVVDIFMFALVARDFSGASGHVEGGYRERRA